MERKSFILYQSYEEQINCLSNEEKGILLSAIFEYSRTQSVSEELPFGANIIFLGIKAGLDRDHEKYMRICERNKENAKHAGRPKKIQSISEKSHNDNDNDNGNDNEKENDIDNGNGIGNGIENDIEQPNAPLEYAPLISAPLSYDPDFSFSTRSAFSEGEEKSQSPLSSADSVHSVPLRAAPPLSTQEKKELFLKGIPTDYIAEREERAAEFAYKAKRSPFSVILEWWEGDKYSAKWNKGKTGISLKDLTDSRYGYEKSYDTDDFFQASLNRAYAAFDAKYGKEGPKSDSENKET